MPDTEQIDYAANAKTLLNVAKTATLNFVMLPGKPNILLLNRARVPQPQVQEALKFNKGKAQIKGTCYTENSVLTFQTLTQPGGTLRSKLTAALKAAGYTKKYKLVGPDGAEASEDEGNESPEAEVEGAEAVEVEEEEEDAEPAEGEQEWRTKQAAIMPGVRVALDLPGFDATELQAVLARATQLAGQRNFTQAVTAMEQAKQLAKAAMTRAAGGNGQQQDAPQNENAPRRRGPRVLLTQARLAWDAARKKVQAELEKLQAAIVAISAGEPDAAKIASGAKKADRILAKLDELSGRLGDKLDEALNAQPDDRPAINKQALNILKEYLAYVNSDPLVQQIDRNPFEPVAVKETMAVTLATLVRMVNAEAA